MARPFERKISETPADFGEPFVGELGVGMPLDVIWSIFELVVRRRNRWA